MTMNGEQITALRAAVEEGWKQRVIGQDLTPGSMKYRRAEVEFFAGAMTAMNAVMPAENPQNMGPAVPAIWIINAISGRPIVEVK